MTSMMSFRSNTNRCVSFSCPFHFPNLSLSLTCVHGVLDGTNLDIISSAAYPVLEIEYKWESVQDDDVTSGVYALFAIGLVIFVYMTYASCRAGGGAAEMRKIGVGTGTFYPPSRPEVFSRTKQNVD